MPGEISVQRGLARHTCSRDEFLIDGISGTSRKGGYLILEPSLIVAKDAIGEKLSCIFGPVEVTG